MKHVLEGYIDPEDVSVEDSGCAKITGLERTDSNLFVRIQSWDEPGHPQIDPDHAEFDALVGKRVRVTIEVIEDEPVVEPEEVGAESPLVVILSGAELKTYIAELEEKHGPEITRVFVRTKLRSKTYELDSDRILLEEKLALLE